MKKKDNNIIHLLPWYLGAGIVGADIGTSVFYSTGILFPYVGYATPLFILFVCLMMFFFKATYEEGCSVSPFNGGAYTMILQTMGRKFAFVVGSLTILSYIATAVVSALAGAFYLSSFFQTAGLPALSIPQIVWFGFIPLLVFGLLNIKGINEPAKIVLLISVFHFGLLIFMDLWGIILCIIKSVDITKIFQDVPKLSSTNILHAFGAAFLGISGFESAAQIIEELKHPAWKTLKKIYLAIVGLVFFTAPITSILCLLLLEHQQILEYKDNLLAGLALIQGGPALLYILSIDACLMLFAAVNTAYVGCTGLMTTMAKQGNLPEIILKKWSHIKWLKSINGYPYAIIPFMIISLILISILPGKVSELGEIYGMAFLGVMFCFCLGVILMRNKMTRKVQNSPYYTKHVINFIKLKFPIPALIGAICLIIAQISLIIYSPSSRGLGLQILFIILLVMAFFRIYILEKRLVSHHDLRIGLGKFRDIRDLPDNLPTYVICAAGAKADKLTTMIINLLESQKKGPKEVIIFHAEDTEDKEGFVSELLTRVITQKVLPRFIKFDIILNLKTLPGTFEEGLRELMQLKPFAKIFIGTGTQHRTSANYKKNIEEMTNAVVEIVPPHPKH